MAKREEVGTLHVMIPSGLGSMELRLDTVGPIRRRHIERAKAILDLAAEDLGEDAKEDGVDDLLAALDEAIGEVDADPGENFASLKRETARRLIAAREALR